MTAADILAARQSLGMTQKQLAEALGVTSTYVSMLETGQRTNPSGALTKLIGLLVKKAG